MPLLSGSYEQEEPLPPPNTVPNVPTGTIGPSGPVATPPAAAPPEAAPSGGGGGGGTPYVPPQLPGIPGLNLPGAPTFNAPKFVAPDAASLMNNPAYQSRLRASTDALERSAAAQGRLRTGGTLSDLTELSSNFAGQAYDQAYNQALQAFDRQYRGAYDAFAPQLEGWRIRNTNLAGMHRDRYNAELGDWMNQRQPRGGGGGPAFDPSMFLDDLMPTMPGPAPMPSGGTGGQGPFDQAPPVNTMRSGDPWTDQERFNYF